MKPRLLLTASAAALLTSCSREDRDCYPNMELGAAYEVRVLEQWSEESSFRWPPHTDTSVTPYPRCNGFDGLQAGASFRIRLTRRTYAPQFGTCAEYDARVLDGVTNVTFTGASGIVMGPFSASGNTSDGRAYTLTTWTTLADPVNARALGGELPPVGIVRGMQSCIDIFAAEMHRLPEPLDASLDAHSMDAGGVEQRR